MSESVYNEELKDLTISINDNVSYFSHFHENVELIHVLDGNYTVYVGGECYQLSKGDTCISFPFVTHRYLRKAENKIFIAITSVDLVSNYDSIFLNYRPITPVIRHGELPECFEQMLTRLAELSSCSTDICDSLCSSYLNAIFGEVLRKLEFKEYRCEMSVTIENILTYCKKNFSCAEINLSSVSNDFGVSDVYVSQVLKKATGHGLSYFLKSMRLRRSRALLYGTTNSITEIAFECGFSNLRTFNRAFSDAFDCTPSDYRKKCLNLKLRETYF